MTSTVSPKCVLPVTSKQTMNKGWSIDRNAWASLCEQLDGFDNWHSVSLTPNDRAMVPAKPGVYAICAPPPNAVGPNRSTMFHSLSSPLYIGRSESSIKSRFLAHCRSNDAQLIRAKRCYHRVHMKFWFIELPIEVIRSAEAWLINCFGPPVNKRAGTITGTIKPPIEA